MDTLGGVELARRRKEAGYTREEFAPLVGISTRRLETWEAQSGPGVPKAKRQLVELVLSRPRDDLSTLSLVALLAARLASGDAAMRRLAELERAHPEIFPSGPLLTDLGPTVADTPSGDGVSRGQQGMPPRRRISDDDGEHDGD